MDRRRGSPEKWGVHIAPFLSHLPLLKSFQYRNELVQGLTVNTGAR